MHNGAQILDLACGTGIDFEHIVDANAKGGLLGLDYSLGKLEQAHERPKNRNRTNVAVCPADAAQSPFADAAFDRILWTYGLKAIPNYQRVLGEVQRVLKPSGLVVVMDAKLSEGWTPFLNPLIRRMARGFLYDVDCSLTSEIARRFQLVQTEEYDFGHTCITGARKE